ncbi:MAG: TIGR02466 family protein [Methylococcales bacterium]
MPSASNPTSSVISLFATPISYRVYENNTDLNRQLAQNIRKDVANYDSDDNMRAHQGGYYSRGGFFAANTDCTRKLASLVQQNIRQYLGEVVSVEYADLANFKLQTWVGVTRRGDYQTPHVHAGANISGVYYVTVPDCPEPQGNIEFITPVDAQEMSFLREVSHSKATIKPRAGGLLIFPSYLRHYTHPFDSDEDRICVVFNVFINQTKKRSPEST